MSDALRNVARSSQSTNQTDRAKAIQVKNNSGGYVFQVSDESRLERFLVTGVDGGTVNVSEQTHARESVDFLTRMILENESAVLNKTVEISVEGRAYKQSSALFTLALVIANGTNKAEAKAAFNKIVRTASHLYEVVDYMNSLAGWGRAKRDIVASWFDKDADKLAYQAVKYRQRNGWTMRDVMRKCHPQGVDQRVATFILKGSNPETVEGDILDGFNKMQKATSVQDVHAVLRDFTNLPWETIPTQFLTDASVWKRLFANGQLRGQAAIRNITRLARIGAFDDMTFATSYANQLKNEDMIRQSRLHPINFLNAAVVHEEGQVDRKSAGYWSYGRNKNWQTNGKIVAALNEGFHKSFKYVEPANKRTLVAIDVSGSMSMNAIGLDLSCAQVSAAVGMTVARTEPYSNIVGFSTNIVDLGINENTSLADAMRKVQLRNFGGTDASAAIQYASKKGIEVDTFVVITDNETWAGNIHPFQALKKYRKETGIDARLAVLGVASTGFTIADPSDRGMMDFAGFDSNGPRALADFSAGRI
jgi:60 kDa SS-A/Ro ribonucleoprotein